MIYNETMPTMTDELFVRELDGLTFGSLDELYEFNEQEREWRELCHADS